MDAALDFPVIYLGNAAEGVAVDNDDLTYEPGGIAALVERAKRLKLAPDQRSDAYRLNAIGSCLTGVPESIHLEAQPHEVVVPFGLCLLLLKGGEQASGKIFLGYVREAEIRPGELESGVLLAQTNPAAAYFVPVDQVAALHRVVAVEPLGIEFVDSLERFVDAGMVGNPTLAINPDWRPWGASHAV